ncbi:hypothetical protein [uncultured Oxalicibacterium sp.]|uniref:hypothetical protein n=1 Tax=uncultured Oxalicibacterium sp. TaxID=1168540 RepID=UPI0025FAE58B|nr:hypothetical protein [uncultured Oxalicibacterium sp.]
MNASSSFSLLTATLLLAACAGKPVPEWQSEAKDAMGRASTAYLKGENRVEQQEFTLARDEVSRTGKIDLLARLELTRCAARVASLVLEDCNGFDALARDTSAAEQAYADYLAGRVRAEQIRLLPEPQRTVAGAGSETAAARAMQSIADPFSRLVAAGVLFRSNRATPDVLQAAIDTASAQGWRRSLLAWLNVQALRAEQVGDGEEAQRIRRRMALVENKEDRKVTP